MKEKTLVVLAAGMGSRFGGLKQIEPIGPNGEFIIDYSVFDAVRAGFNKVVFIIKEENYDIFKETIGKRIENHVKVEYVFQSFDDIPKGVIIPNDRVKPFGTAHALYCARNSIKGPFGIISSDDFYGPESYDLLSKALDNKDEYPIIGYRVGSTISENGSVKRGVIFEDENHNITAIKESKVEKVNGVIECKTLDGKESFTVQENHPVFMLISGFQKEFVDYIEKDIANFFEKNKDDLTTVEYLLPVVMDQFLKDKKVKYKVYDTPAKWYGMTYKEDEEIVRNNINKLIEEGVYKNDLWS